MLCLDENNKQAKTALVILDILQQYARFPENRLEYAEEDTAGSSGHKNVRLVFFKLTVMFAVTKYTILQSVLPFHELVNDPWKILREEVNEHNVTRLLPLTIPLNISPDKFYLAVIDKIIIGFVSFVSFVLLVL